MQVTIFYRNSFIGGDGWTYYPLRLEIGDRCPKCGGPRGKVHHALVIEGGEFFLVDGWENPCGHVDLYKDCFFESISSSKVNQGEAK